VIAMTETALIHMQGGRWDGTLFEIEIDPLTNEPPQTFEISEDGLLLLDPHSLKPIGRQFGSNASGSDFLSPRSAEECPTD
jgi:hypothetical protein